MNQFSSADLEQLKAKGISEATVKQQLARFRTGFPYLRIESPSAPGAGMLAIDKELAEAGASRWEMFLQDGSSYLARCVGQKKAREIWYLCRQYTAEEALQMGMVNKVVPLEQLEDEVVDWCRTIIKRSPFAIRMIKRALNAELDGQHGLMEFAGDATLMYYLMDEAQEGAQAFLDKRDPDFDKFPQFPG